MNTENRIQWGAQGDFEKREMLLEEARRLHSQAVVATFVSMATWLRRVFDTLVASPLEEAIIGHCARKVPHKCPACTPSQLR